jgi:hypothetical protein
MRLRTVVTKCRLLAVLLLLAGTSLEMWSRQTAESALQLPLAQAARVSLQVGSDQVPVSLQLYRSKIELAPLSQVRCDKDVALLPQSLLRGGSVTNRLNGWRTAPAKPLCEQALHQRTGVFLS